MDSKRRNYWQYSTKGFTLFEMILVLAILALLFTISYKVMSPVTSRNKATDTKRISDISNLDRAINEYRLDAGNYPGTSDVLYLSNVIPAGSANVYSALSGWIPADLRGYLSKYPTDPVNDDTYRYKYTHNNSTYEISARLEQLLDEAGSDGGNDPQSYEIGSNLGLISP